MSNTPDSSPPPGGTPEAPDSEYEELPSLAPSIIPPKPKPHRKSKEDLAEPLRRRAEAPLVSTPVAGPNPAAQVSTEAPAPQIEAAQVPPIQKLPWPEPEPAPIAAPPEAAATAPEPATTTHTRVPEPRPGSTRTKAADAPAAAAASKGEHHWLIILGLAIAVVLGVVLFLLRQALPSDSPNLPVAAPTLPIKGEKLSIEALTLGWRRGAETGESGAFSKFEVFPEADFRLSPSSNGAVRVFFRNDRGQQVGDTANFKIKDGRARESDANIHIVCSEGLVSTVEYDDLRSRANKNWTIEIREGEDPMAPIATFKLLCRAIIPWNLSERSKP